MKSVKILFLVATIVYTHGSIDSSFGRSANSLPPVALSDVASALKKAQDLLSTYAAQQEGHAKPSHTQSGSSIVGVGEYANQKGSWNKNKSTARLTDAKGNHTFFTNVMQGPSGSTLVGSDVMAKIKSMTYFADAPNPNYHEGFTGNAGKKSFKLYGDLSTSKK